jgi:1,4-alpha-glucan branching enzyme
MTIEKGSKAPASQLTTDDLYWFNEGTHRRLGEKLGAHRRDDGEGTHFAVWAPNATAVSVIGDFNGWHDDVHVLDAFGGSGIWEGTAREAAIGDVYKFAIFDAEGTRHEKADPFASYAEEAPRTGSVVWDLAYDWHDADWMAGRKATVALDAPMTTYEVHLGSWRRAFEEPGRLFSYEEIAPQLIEHVLAMGFTHIEFLPLMEHPFYGSWGYQVTGFFAPTSRYGTPQQFMGLVDQLHQAGIGVILDWVPSHFPTDPHGLALFDGTHLFEHADPRMGFHPDWNSLIFNYGRHEVRAFLASSAEQWLGTYHADALRVDAVASMLYRDYSRKAGEWLPNEHGGRENLEAVSFLCQLNAGIYADHPDVQTIAEESTAWPGVSHPTDVGGLGFGLKWDMGWMHDTLEYFAQDPIYRRYHHGELTFRSIYAFTENFVLPLSHDEVVHGKGSMLNKMPGDEWQQFAGLRLLYGYQYSLPGKKLLFQGDELGTRAEWNHDEGLDWGLLENGANAGLARWVGDLNRLVRAHGALHELDVDPAGFEWVLAGDADISVLAYLRRSKAGEPVLVVCNFTPVPRHNLLVGVPSDGLWHELVNSDAAIYGGSGQGNMGGVVAQPVPWHESPHTLTVTAPPLGCVVFSREDPR